jgi:hypothetical protein
MSAHRVFWRDADAGDDESSASASQSSSPSLINQHAGGAVPRADAANRHHTASAASAASDAVNAHCERLAATVRDGVIGANSIANTPFGARLKNITIMKPFSLCTHFLHRFLCLFVVVSCFKRDFFF